MELLLLQMKKNDLLSEQNKKLEVLITQKK